MASVAVMPEEIALPAGWDSEPHPWRRYGARTIDILVFSSLLFFVLGFVFAFAWPPAAAWLVAPPFWANFVIFTPAGIALTGLGVAVCHALWGSTPGKWIFRLKVRGSDAGNLSLWDALRREIILFWWGYGLGLPFVSLLMLVVSYNELENDGQTRWDRVAGSQSLGSVIKGASYSWLVVGVILVIAAKLFGTAAMFTGATR